MKKLFSLVAFALLASAMIGSMSHAAPSCCDPANAAQEQKKLQPEIVQQNPINDKPVATNAQWRGISSYMGYNAPQNTSAPQASPGCACCLSPIGGSASRVGTTSFPNRLQRPIQGIKSDGNCCGNFDTILQPIKQNPPTLKREGILTPIGTTIRVAGVAQELVKGNQQTGASSGVFETLW